LTRRAGDPVYTSYRRRVVPNPDQTNIMQVCDMKDSRDKLPACHSPKPLPHGLPMQLSEIANADFKKCAYFAYQLDKFNKLFF